MALSEQVAAYDDCNELYEKAIADPVGARAKFETYNEASYFRLRMNHYRVLLRRESRRMYDSAAPQYNKSEYDGLICRIREDTEGAFWVYAERHGQIMLAVETLSEGS